MEGWDSFLVAEVGASAVLLGLIFVGVSINLTKILALPTLPSRAVEALVLLSTALLACSLLLVPGQSKLLIGAELLIVGLFSWLFIVAVDLRIWRTTEYPYRRMLPVMIVINQISIVPYMIAGVSILVSGFGG